MANKTNPIELQKHLSGIDYPATKDTLVSTARDQGAGHDLLDALKKIPDRQYDGPNAVSQAVAKGD
jgi:hypothetical protein